MEEGESWNSLVTSLSFTSNLVVTKPLSEYGSPVYRTQPMV